MSLERNRAAQNGTLQRDEVDWIVLFLGRRSDLNAFPESFFFHRGDPIWLFFVLGVLGLRQVSLRPIAVRAAS